VQPAQNEYKLENFQKSQNFLKKVLTNRFASGILIKRSRERAKKRLDDSAKAKHFVN